LKRTFSALALLVFVACGSAPPSVEPAATPAPAPQPAAPSDLGIVQVTASAVNVRREPSTDAAVVTQAKKNERLTLLSTTDEWSKVRLGDGTTGWVASRFVAKPGAAPSKSSSREGGCNTDFAFVKTPTVSMSEHESRHGLVIVDAYVSAAGDVTSTKVISNHTGDAALAELAQREIRAAKFTPPKRNCAAKAFIFTYKRSF
jgi:uncharacterized protein YgiM (DUF1202 family)